MTWEELVADVTARHPLHESKMFGMPCLKRENGKVVAGHWKDGGLTVKLTDERSASTRSQPAPSRSTPAWDGDEGVGARPEALSDEWLGSSTGDLSGRADRAWPRRGPVKADRPELSLLEITFDPGSGVDPHFHKGHSDSFYVLEGELEFHVGDEVVRATPGAYVLAPPNVVHWFRNGATTPARMLNLHTPGGFVQYRASSRPPRAGHRADLAFFERHDVFDV